MLKLVLVATLASVTILPAFAGEQHTTPTSLGTLRLDLNVQETPQVMSQWNIWRAQLNELIDNRFETLAKARFKSSPALKAEVLFSVTKDGRISGAELSNKSNNLFFDMLTLDSIKSLAGDNRLSFPPGSNKLVMSGHKVFDIPAASDFSRVVPTQTTKFK
ncbi:MAG TPA: hypothetical protein V6D22_12575 [Candidatus Obscuribacterales bacterium]